MGSFETRVLLFVLLGLCLGFAQCRTVDLPFRTGRVGVSPIDWQIQQDFCVSTANRTLLSCSFKPCCVVGSGTSATAEKFGTRYLSPQTENGNFLTFNDLYFSTENSVLRYVYTIESKEERAAFDVTFTTTFQTPMDVVSSSSGDARLDTEDFWFITRPQKRRTATSSLSTTCISPLRTRFCVTCTRSKARKSELPLMSHSPLPSKRLWTWCRVRQVTPDWTQRISGLLLALKIRPCKTNSCCTFWDRRVAPACRVFRLDHLLN